MKTFLAFVLVNICMLLQDQIIVSSIFISSEIIVLIWILAVKDKAPNK